MMLAEARLQSFARSLGIADWTPDAYGRRTLRFDGMLVQFEELDRRTIQMETRLGRLPAESWQAESVLQSMLRANLARRAAGRLAPGVLTIDETSAIVFLFHVIKVDSIADHEFLESVDAFVSDCEFWRARWRE